MKLPALQFYPGDWKRDAGVQSLSIHDRGVWFECLLLMHDSSERGVLLINGRPPSVAALARILGLSAEELAESLKAIEAAGVSSLRQDGAIFSRRMVRDEDIRSKRVKAGLKGGNPNLLKQNPTKTSNGGKPLSNQIPEDEDEDETEDQKELDPIITLPPPSGPVLLTRSQLNKLENEWGSEQVRYLVRELAAYAVQNPVKFKKYKDHLLVLRQWQKMRLEKGRIWFQHPVNGWGYYPGWEMSRLEREGQLRE